MRALQALENATSSARIEQPSRADLSTNTVTVDEVRTSFRPDGFIPAAGGLLLVAALALGSGGATRTTAPPEWGTQLMQQATWVYAETRIRLSRRDLILKARAIREKAEARRRALAAAEARATMGEGA